MRQSKSRHNHCPKFISIHAPVKGATIDGNQVYETLKISIHAPVKGATTVPIDFLEHVTISIHAPVKGATSVLSPDKHVV
ncbi:hypothetical protein SMULJ23_0386 [Streptococcus mutans LJ23]|nr:hypothetical protein SMULJ23_0386 [Streptococcus mutans LJ23]